MRYILICTLALSVGVHADIYKWIDKNGVTHYDDKKPKGVGSKIIDETNRETAKALNPMTKSLAETLVDEVVSVKNESSDLSCPQSVSNSKSSIETMLSTGEKNVKDGYMSQSEYLKVASQLRKIKAQLSVDSCNSSKGSERGFYRCMSDGNNHIAGCGQKYKFGG